MKNLVFIDFLFLVAILEESFGVAWGQEEGFIDEHV